MDIRLSILSSMMGIIIGLAGIGMNEFINVGLRHFGKDRLSRDQWYKLYLVNMIIFAFIASFWCHLFVQHITSN